jgi:predicted CXXCH cytochrome family protein
MNSFAKYAKVLLLPLVFYSSLGSQSETCSNQKCHEGMLSRKVVHPVVRLAGCTACHIVENTPTDSSAKHESKLLMQGNDLCFLCHPARRTQVESVKHTHVPVTLSCLLCHDPHGSDHARMFRQALPTLCFTCHPDKGHASPADWHKPIKEGQCIKCHDVHGSDNPRMTKGAGRNLCYNCHWLDGPKGKHSIKTDL